MRSDTIRAFTAIEVRQADRLVPAYYMAAMHDFRNPNLMVEGFDNMHITLNFLGDQPVERVACIINAMTHVLTERDHQRPAFIKPMFGRPSGFPPRILYLSMLGTTHMNRVQAALHEELKDMCGLEESVYPFTPHVTLGRLPKNTPPDHYDDMLKWLQGLHDDSFMSLPLMLPAVSLMHSIRNDDGSITYERIASVSIQR